MRRHRHHPDDFLQAAIQIELGGVQDELAGFDFGEVQDVVDDGKQRFAGYAHGVEVIALFFVKFRIQGKFGHADDAVHWGADLMAHVGQEFAFGTAGGLRAVSRIHQFGGAVGDLLFEKVLMLQHSIECVGELAKIVIRQLGVMRFDSFNRPPPARIFSTLGTAESLCWFSRL